MNAYRDENGIPTMIAASSSDGSTIIRVKVNVANNSLKVVNATTGSDHGPTNALHDENNVPIIMAVSSVDGKTPVAVYADSNGNLLINSN